MVEIKVVKWMVKRRKVGWLWTTRKRASGLLVKGYESARAGLQTVVFSSLRLFARFPSTLWAPKKRKFHYVHLLLVIVPLGETLSYRDISRCRDSRESLDHSSTGLERSWIGATCSIRLFSRDILGRLIYLGWPLWTLLSVPVTLSTRHFHQSFDHLNHGR